MHPTEQGAPARQPAFLLLHPWPRGTAPFPNSNHWAFLSVYESHSVRAAARRTERGQRGPGAALYATPGGPDQGVGGQRNPEAPLHQQGVSVWGEAALRAISLKAGVSVAVLCS